MKVAVVGLDGACMDLIMEWAKDGKLPTFGELMEDGCYGRLESTIPTVTIPAWNCMTTGMNPGKIGCFSFIQKEYGTYNFKIYSSLVEKEVDIWDILNIYGKKIFLFNLPNIQMAYRINGYMVAGFLCMRDEYFTYPKDLKDKLDKLGFERDITDLGILGAMGDKEHSRRHEEITQSQCKVLENLIRDDEWDFIFLVLNELDRIQHRFWHKRNVVLSHYKNIDRNVKMLIDRILELDDYNIFIVSDHGFGPNKKVFHINEWLLRKELLTVEREDISLGIVRRIITTLKKPWLVKLVRPFLSTALLRRIYQKALNQTAKVPVIWEKTKAFSYGSFGHIYINLKGREPNGTVDPDEYERLRDFIIEELRKMSVKAYRSEELYSGKYMKVAPDIVIQTDEFVSTVSGRVCVDIFVDGFGGAHDRLNGTFIACGPDIKNVGRIDAHIYDITPTILYMFDVPVPRDTDGRVIREILKNGKSIKYADYTTINIRHKIKKLRELKRI